MFVIQNYFGSNNSDFLIKQLAMLKNFTVKKFAVKILSWKFILCSGILA